MDFNYDNATLNIKNDVGFITFPILSKYPFVNHAFSTRLGGVSKDQFSSMNLSFNRGDKDENVIENYHRLCEAAGFDFNTLVASCQDHGTNIRVVTEKDKGVGIFKEQDMRSVDGLLTNRQGVSLVTYYADCTPIFFLDKLKRVIGLAHAGWRGTVGEIANKMVEKMHSDFGSELKDIICVIGPSIGPCCYEVDKPVYDKFDEIKGINPESISLKVGSQKYRVSLWETNRRILLKSGIPEENIVISGVCTGCNSELLFSHRVTKGERGGMVAMMALRG